MTRPQPDPARQLKSKSGENADELKAQKAEYEQKIKNEKLKFKSWMVSFSYSQRSDIF